MKVIAPITVTDGQLSSSNVTEDDYDEWDESVTYTTGDFVIVSSEHRVYQASQDSTGQDPTVESSDYWTNYSATNRWKAFDRIISDQVSNAGTITYSIVPESRVTGIAFFGLEAAEVRVVVTDTTPEVVHDETISLVDATGLVSWYTMFTTDLTVYDTEALFTGIPGYAGNQIDITIGDGTGTAKVGQVVLGTVETIGETLDGTEIGINDFSTKEQDELGSPTLVERGHADETLFKIAIPTDNGRLVKRTLAALRATPAVYFADADITRMGATVYGYYEDFRIPLGAGGRSYATLEIKGLI
jgi:hypothetical protein